MKDTLKFLLGRIPWRILLAFVGLLLVVKGGAQLLSVQLPADADAVMQVAKQGMVMVVMGGVMLIAAIMVR